MCHFQGDQNHCQYNAGSTLLYILRSPLSTSTATPHPLLLDSFCIHVHPQKCSPLISGTNLKTCCANQRQQRHNLALFSSNRRMSAVTSRCLQLLEAAKPNTVKMDVEILNRSSPCCAACPFPCMIIFIDFGQMCCCNRLWACLRKWVQQGLVDG